ncbi:MAG: right-handed parallel beta-helix repeat-containing protein [Candidatus Eiseniibacteriota bacterium]
MRLPKPYSATLTATLLLLYGVEGWAVVRRVPSEYATIQAAIDASTAGDSVLVAPGIYTDYTQRIFHGFQRHACVFLADGVMLLSEGGPEVTTIDMQQAAVFQANVIYGEQLLSGQTMVEGFTVTGVPTDRAGAFVVDSERVTFRDCVFRDMGGPYSAALSSRYTDVDVTSCVFTDLVGFPAGISVLEADLTVDACDFRNCVERAIGLQGADLGVPEQAVIRNSVFLNNAETGSGGGGAININDYEAGITITDCYFEGNTAISSGGAIAIGAAGPWSILDCVFWRNQAPGQAAGAVFAGAIGGAGTLTGCTFEANGSLLPGSAVYLDFGSVTFTNNLITGSIGAQAVYKLTGGAVTKGCNVYWNNAGGNTLNFGLDLTDRIVDPQYCDAPSGDLTVFDTSPCLPANSLGCGLIGAQDQGCGTVSVERTSWGKIKEGYK